MCSNFCPALTYLHFGSRVSEPSDAQYLNYLKALPLCLNVMNADMSAEPQRPPWSIPSSPEQQGRFKACHKFISSCAGETVFVSSHADNIRGWISIFSDLITDSAEMVKDDEILHLMSVQRKKSGSTEPRPVIELLFWSMKELKSRHQLSLKELEQFFKPFGTSNESTKNGIEGPVPWDNTQMISDLMVILQHTRPVELRRIFPELSRLEIGSALIATRDRNWVLHELQERAKAEGRDPEEYEQDSGKLRDEVVVRWTMLNNDSWGKRSGLTIARHFGKYKSMVKVKMSLPNAVSLIEKVLVTMTDEERMRVVIQLSFELDNFDLKSNRSYDVESELEALDELARIQNEVFHLGLIGPGSAKAAIGETAEPWQITNWEESAAQITSKAEALGLTQWNATDLFEDVERIQGMPQRVCGRQITDMKYLTLAHINASIIVATTQFCAAMHNALHQEDQPETDQHLKPKQQRVAQMDTRPTVMIKKTLTNGQEVELPWESYYELDQQHEVKRTEKRLGIMRMYTNESKAEFGLAWNTRIERQIEADSEETRELEKARIKMMLSKENFRDLKRKAETEYFKDVIAYKQRKRRHGDEHGRNPVVANEIVSDVWANIQGEIPSNQKGPLLPCAAVDNWRLLQIDKAFTQRQSHINFEAIPEEERNRIFTIVDRLSEPNIKEPIYHVALDEEDMEECCVCSLALWTQYTNENIHGHDKEENRAKNLKTWISQGEQLHYLRGFSMCRNVDRDKFLIMMTLTFQKEEAYNEHAPMMYRCEDRNLKLNTPGGFSILIEKLQKYRSELNALEELKTDKDWRLSDTQRQSLEGLKNPLAKMASLCHKDLMKVQLEDNVLPLPEDYVQVCEELKRKAIAELKIKIQGMLTSKWKTSETTSHEEASTSSIFGPGSAAWLRNNEVIRASQGNEETQGTFYNNGEAVLPTLEQEDEAVIVNDNISNCSEPEPQPQDEDAIRSTAANIVTMLEAKKAKQDALVATPREDSESDEPKSKKSKRSSSSDEVMPDVQAQSSTRDEEEHTDIDAPEDDATIRRFMMKMEINKCNHDISSGLSFEEVLKEKPRYWIYDDNREKLYRIEFVNRRILHEGLQEGERECPKKFRELLNEWNSGDWMPSGGHLNRRIWPFAGAHHGGDTNNYTFISYFNSDGKDVPKELWMSLHGEYSMQQMHKCLQSPTMLAIQEGSRDAYAKWEAFEIWKSTQLRSHQDLDTDIVTITEMMRKRKYTTFTQNAIANEEAANMRGWTKPQEEVRAPVPPTHVLLDNSPPPRLQTR